MDKFYKIWDKDKTVEGTTLKRATGELEPMESTKQAVELISEVYKPNMSVLDVGCAYGHYYREFKKRFADIHYTGVDASQHFIDKAQEIFVDAEFKVADIFDLNLGKFDIVLCANVILHLPEFRRPIKNLIKATNQYCFIRTLINDYTSKTKFFKTDNIDEHDEPIDYAHQNTWSFKILNDYIQSLGNYSVELIDDKADLSVLKKEQGNIGKLKGETQIVDNLQIAGNTVFNWKWLKITK